MNIILKKWWLLNQASSSGITPKNPRIQLVKSNDNFFFSIGMEHIFGNKMSDNYLSVEDIFCDDEFKLKDKYDGGFQLEQQLKNKLKEYNIRYLDLHEGNVILYRNRVKIIDFTPVQNLCFSSTLNSNNFKKTMKNTMKEMKRSIL